MSSPGNPLSPCGSDDGWQLMQWPIPVSYEAKGRDGAVSNPDPPAVEESPDHLTTTREAMARMTIVDEGGNGLEPVEEVTAELEHLADMRIQGDGTVSDPVPDTGSLSNLTDLFIRCMRPALFSLLSADLPSLRKIVVYSSSCCHEEERAMVTALVTKHASKLRILNMGCPLPFDPDHPIVYLRLEELHCSILPDDAATACPMLRLLSVSGIQSVHLIDRLPTRLVSLHLDLKQENVIRSMYELVSAVSRLVHLQSLSLILDQRMWHDPDGVFVDLCKPLIHLKKLCIDLCNSELLESDHLVQRLACWCPGLQSLWLHNMILTDYSLASLSPMPQLNTLHLDVVNRFTSKGWRFLLSSPVMSSLDYLFIGDAGDDVALIEHQLTCLSRIRGGDSRLEMMGERGILFQS